VRLREVRVVWEGNERWWREEKEKEDQRKGEIGREMCERGGGLVDGEVVRGDLRIGE
jgi:hypothetical protein